MTRHGHHQREGGVPRIWWTVSQPRGGGCGCPRRQRPERVRATYEFIKAHRDKYSVQAMCRVLGVAPSGYYAWLAQPISNRAQEDARLLRLIRASFTASQGIYGAPRVFLDLREAGEDLQQASRRTADARASACARCTAIACGAGRSASPRS